MGEARRIVGLSDDRTAVATLRAAHPGVAARVVEALDPQRAGRVLGFLPSDHQVEILGAMDAEVRARVEAALAPEETPFADRMLAFPESAVARLMTSRVWRVPLDVTVGGALKALRDGADAIEVAQNCCVANDLGRLKGIAALRDLAVADPARPLNDLMREDVIAVREEASKGNAAEIIAVAMQRVLRRHPRHECDAPGLRQRKGGLAGGPEEVGGSFRRRSQLGVTRLEARQVEQVRHQAFHLPGGAGDGSGQPRDPRPIDHVVRGPGLQEEQRGARHYRERVLQVVGDRDDGLFARLDGFLLPQLSVLGHGLGGAHGEAHGEDVPFVDRRLVAGLLDREDNDIAEHAVLPHHRVER